MKSNHRDVLVVGIGELLAITVDGGRLLRGRRLRSRLLRGRLLCGRLPRGRALLRDRLRRDHLLQGLSDEFVPTQWLKQD